MLQETVDGITALRLGAYKNDIILCSSSDDISSFDFGRFGRFELYTRLLPKHAMIVILGYICLLISYIIVLLNTYVNIFLCSLLLHVMVIKMLLN